MKIWKMSDNEINEINPDLEEVQKLVGILKAYHSAPKPPESNAILDMLGTEKYPYRIRMAITGIVDLLDYKPYLVTAIPPELDEYFSSYTKRYNPKFLRSAV